jgi:thioredoxin reductase (NADPH)
MTKGHDVIIIGAGPAGLTAGIYCARSGLSTLILEKTAVGGQVIKSDIVENYPGFPEGISGFELMEKMKKQAERFGAEFIGGEISALMADNSEMLTLNTSAGEKYSAKAVIIATGANPKKLGIKGEEELNGKGVSYCATCDGPLFRNKDVIVIGGGDSAVGEAIYLAKLAKSLILVHRRDALRASKILQDRLFSGKNVRARWNCVPVEIMGISRVEGLKIRNVKTNTEETVPANGIFVYVGLEPNTSFLKGKLDLDGQGFVTTDEKMQTSLKGVFACGDVRKNMLKQVVTACAEGAQAACSCWHYIEGLPISPSVKNLGN